MRKEIAKVSIGYENYTFFLNDAIPASGKRFVTCETEENDFGYVNTVILNSEGKAYTTNRKMGKARLKQVTRYIKAFEKEYC